MTKPLSTSANVVLVVTHACALAAGFYLWSAWGKGGELFAAKDDQPSRSYRSSAGRGDAPDDRVSSRQLMDRLVKMVSEPADFDSRTAANNKRIIAAADALEPAADRKAAAIAALAEWHELEQSGAGVKDEDWLKLSARFLHWMREDPREAIAYLSATAEDSFARKLPDAMKDMMLAAVSEADTKNALSWLGAGANYDNELKWMLADKLAESTDLVGIATFKEHFAPDWEKTRLLLARNWPPDQAEAFANWAASEGAPEMMATFAMAKGEEGGRWLVEKLASGGLSDEEKIQVMSSADYRALMWRCRSLDYDFRVGTLEAYYTSKSPERVRRELSDSDVGYALEKDRDWRHAFASGTVTADEVYAAISSAIPNVSANAEEAMRDSLFRQLAEEDGGRAMRLLDSLPPEKKWNTVLSAADGMFHGVNPQRFYDYMQNIPPEVTADSLDRRFNAWSNLGRENHERLGDTYVDWVGKLPDGLDKDMASLSLIQSLGRSNPTVTDKLASGIRDPRVRERLPKSP